MKTPGPLFIVILSIALAILTGCAGSQPSRFYVLSAMEVSGKEQPRPCPDGRAMSLGINPVGLPRYLDRPQIMTKLSDNEFRISELNVWAEPLKEGIQRVIAQDLSSLLCADIVVYPSTVPRQTDCRLSVEVNRFEGSLGGDLYLEVRWSVSDDRSGKVLLTKRSLYTEPVGSHDYPALAHACSRALHALSRDVAETVGSMTQGGSH